MTNYIYTNSEDGTVLFCQVNDYKDGSVRVNIQEELHGAHVNTFMFYKEHDSVTLAELKDRVGSWANDYINGDW